MNISFSVLSPEPKRKQIVRIDNVGKSLHIDELWEKSQPKQFLNWSVNQWKLLSMAIDKLEKTGFIMLKIGIEIKDTKMFRSDINILGYNIY